MDTEEGIKTLQTKIKGWNTANILEKIHPHLEKFSNLKNRMKDPRVARSILTRLDHLFILKHSVEELQRRSNEKLDPVISFDDVKLATKLLRRYPQFLKSGWWDTKWDRLLTIATYYYGWGMVDVMVAQDCGFSTKWDTKSLIKTPLMGRFLNSPSFSQLCAHANNLECLSTEPKQLNRQEFSFSFQVNEKSKSAKSRKWLPRSAREQRMRSIISLLRKEMKKRSERLERAKKAKALKDKKDTEREKIKKQRILKKEREKMKLIKNNLKLKSSSKVSPSAVS